MRSSSVARVTTTTKAPSVSLFPWRENYETTISGTPVLTEDFIDFPDNAHPELRSDAPIPPAEYILLATNISSDRTEQVGVWTASASLDHVRNYLAGVEVPNTADCRVHCIGMTEKSLGPISADLRKPPSYAEVIDAQKNLSRYGLPASSRYPAATSPATDAPQMTPTVLPIFFGGRDRSHLHRRGLGLP